MINHFAIAIGVLLVIYSKMVLANFGGLFSEDKSRPFMATTAGKLDESPQKYAGSTVQLYGADMSLAFREFESSDAGLAPFVTAQINGRGHVRGVGTKFIFLIPKDLQQKLLREHGPTKTIHADILVRVRPQKIPTRGGEITHVGEILKVQEIEPR